MTLAKAPHYQGEVVPILDLWELLASGRAGELCSGRVQAGRRGERTRTARCVRGTLGDGVFLIQRYDNVTLCYDQSERLYGLVIEGLNTDCLVQEAPEDALLWDIHAGEGAVRFSGSCLTHFATLPKLIALLPADAASTYYGYPWDRAVLVKITRDKRELEFWYRLRIVETRERGQFDADYFLEKCTLQAGSTGLSRGTEGAVLRGVNAGYGTAT